jgi:ribonuclease R
MKAVSSFARISGLRVPRSLDRHDIQTLIDKVRGSDLEFAINRFILRSFEKAQYSPLNIGHYALSSRHYSHFTSPIRRYADLTIHRLVQCYIEGKLDKPNIDEILTEGELIEIGSHISNTEVKATNAERELKKILILEMLSERIGDDMDTIVSGVTKFGVFVQCMKFGIEGLIPLQMLGNDQWQYQESSQAVVGKLSGKKISLGMAMKVRIVAVNVAGRHLDVAPTEPIVSRDDIAGKKKKSKKLKRKLTKKFKKKIKR